MATYRVVTNGPRFCAADLRVRDITLQPGTELDIELDESDIAALRAFVGESAPIAGVYAAAESPGRTGPAQAVVEAAPSEPGVVATESPTPPDPPKRASRRRVHADDPDE